MNANEYITTMSPEFLMYLDTAAMYTAMPAGITTIFLINWPEYLIPLALVMLYFDPVALAGMVAIGDCALQMESARVPDHVVVGSAIVSGAALSMGLFRKGKYFGGTVVGVYALSFTSMVYVTGRMSGL